MKRLFGLAAIVLLCGGVLAACTVTSIQEGPAPGMKVDSPSPYIAGIRMNSVAVLDDSLQEWYIYENSVTGVHERGKKGKIAVENCNARRTPTGTVEAFAVLRNRTDYDLQVEGRVQFFDRDKAPVEGPTAWQRVYLPSNGVATYRECSTNINDVAFYYIEIREGR